MNKTIQEIDIEIEKLEALKAKIEKTSCIPFTKKESNRWYSLTDKVNEACDIEIPIRISICIDEEGDLIDIYSDGWEQAKGYKLTEKDLKPLKTAQKALRRYAVELAKKYKTTVEEIEKQLST